MDASPSRSALGRTGRVTRSRLWTARYPLVCNSYVQLLAPAGCRWRAARPAGPLPLITPVPSTPASTRSRREQFAALRSVAPVVLPSLLLCDFGRLAEEIARLEVAGVKALHLDVMDGHFVPNLSYGLPIVEACRKATKLPIDVHLMISDPAQYIEQFYKAGADNLTIHIEAVPNARPVLEKIRALGASAGIALNPPTPLTALESVLDCVDVVLVMSVMPGFGGQKFQDVALDKVRKLRERLGNRMFLEVDGGVNDGTISRCAEAGANLFVVGSAIFGHPEYGERVQTLNRLSTVSRQ